VASLYLLSARPECHILTSSGPCRIWPFPVSGDRPAALRSRSGEDRPRHPSAARHLVGSKSMRAQRAGSNDGCNSTGAIPTSW
jgi:hypothetical protein